MFVEKANAITLILVKKMLKYNKGLPNKAALYLQSFTMEI